MQFLENKKGGASLLRRRRCFEWRAIYPEITTRAFLGPKSKQGLFVCARKKAARLLLCFGIPPEGFHDNNFTFP